MVKSSFNHKNIIIIMFATVIGLFIRIMFFNHETSDFSFFLTSWMNSIEEVDGFRRFGMDLGDYTCPYMYILALITFLPFNRLYSIKAVSCFFDFILAYFASDIIFTLSKDKIKAAYAYLAIFLCPTVIMNSAVWGQCDVIYTAFTVGALSFILKNCPVKSCILYGIAFAIKLQSIFFAPILICLWFKGKIKIKHLFIIPAVYCLIGVPAVLAGRNIVSLFTVYFRQGSEYPYLSLNASSLLGFTQDLLIESTPLLTLLSILFAGLFVLLILIITLRPKSTIDNLQWIELASIFVFTIPFLLPKMHERYFYLADIFSIIYSFCHKKRWFVPLLVVFASSYTYLRYLYREAFRQYPLVIGSVAMLTAIIVLLIDYYKNNLKSQQAR